MRQIETPNGYLAIEVIGGIDVYCDDCYVCELAGKTFEDFSKDEIIDTNELDDAIEEELDTQEVMDRITDPYNFI
jgi:hypothetical protein